MITGFLTFLFFFAIVGCVLYGRKLIRTEKVDAVFGNPERAKGGIHWVIVGSSFLLLVWLYYSWDIAKSFFPKSANELCQVGKVNESLLSLKYLFPIDERQLKSTSVIETESENLDKISIEIEKSGIKNQDKSKLINFVSQTKNTIPLLTNEQLLNNETIEQINAPITVQQYNADGTLTNESQINVTDPNQFQTVKDIDLSKKPIKFDGRTRINVRLFPNEKLKLYFRTQRVESSDFLKGGKKFFSQDFLKTYGFFEEYDTQIKSDNEKMNGQLNGDIETDCDE